MSPSSAKPWQWSLMVTNFRKKVKNLGWSRVASAPRCMVHVRRYLGIFARDEDCVHLLGKPLLRRSIMTGHWQPRPLPAILTRILPSTPTSQFNQQSTHPGFKSLCSFKPPLGLKVVDKEFQQFWWWWLLPPSSLSPPCQSRGDASCSIASPRHLRDNHVEKGNHVITPWKQENACAVGISHG